MTRGMQREGADGMPANGVRARSWLARALVCAALAAAAVPRAQAATYTLICAGLGGEATYDEQFNAQVEALRRAALTLGTEAQLQVLSGRGCTRDALAAQFKRLDAQLTAEDRFALYLVGHGSFDGDDYRFNMPGPDATGRELQGWLAALPAREQLVVATGSSSGALQELLKAPQRVVLTATRAGGERNATRFGTEFAAALSDPAADGDKNGNISVQEAFDFAQKRVQDFYQREVRIASEHAVLAGGRAASVSVARVGGASAGTLAGVGDAGADAAPVVDTPERRALLASIDAVRVRKTELKQDDYYGQLEPLLVRLARLDVDASAAAGPRAGAGGTR